MKRFYGAWKLKSFYMTTCNNKVKFFPLGKKSKGTLLYTKEKIMSVQITKSKRMFFSSKFATLGKGKKKEIADTIENYVAYSGTYAVNDDTVTHHIKHHIIPNEEGKKYVRYYAFENNELILRTEPIKFGVFSLVLTLIWCRGNINV